MMTAKDILSYLPSTQEISRSSEQAHHKIDLNPACPDVPSTPKEIRLTEPSCV